MSLLDVYPYPWISLECCSWWQYTSSYLGFTLPRWHSSLNLCQAILIGFYSFTYYHWPSCKQLFGTSYVLGLGPWPNTCVEMCSWAFLPHKPYSCFENTNITSSSFEKYTNSTLIKPGCNSCSCKETLNNIDEELVLLRWVRQLSWLLH